MNFNPVSLGAAPLVAAALGRSLGVKVEVSRHTSTAKTNGKVIMLPVLPVDLDDDLSSLLWGFIHHEAGHCRHTEFEVFADPEVQSDAFLGNLLNALEDIRMERAHMSVYPGSVRILSDLVRTLVDVGFFEPLPRDATDSHIFHAYILSELRSTVLGQTALRSIADQAKDMLVQSLGHGFVTRLTAHMQQILDAESTADVYALAIRIRQFLQDEMQNSAPEPDPSESDDGSSSSDTQGDGTSDPESGDEDTQCGSPSSGQNDGNDEDGDDCADSLQASGSNDDQSDPSNSASDVLKQILEEDDIDNSLGDLGDALSEMLSDGIKEQSSRKVAIPAEHPRSPGYRDNTAITEARAVSTKLAVRLKRQLESVGAVVSNPSYRGKRISRRHLSRVRHGDYRVFQHREFLPTVNTAVVSLIDVSSSMEGVRAELASRAILSTALALHTIADIEHCVGAFPGPSGNASIELVQDFSDTPERISSRYALHARGYTPLAEALLWAFDRMVRRPEKRRLIFVATDGQPDDPASSKQILAHAKRLNLEVHGLGIQTDDHLGLFESFVTVQTLNDLPQAFLSLFQRVLRRSA